ncbi:hypothetical protein RQP46_008873 [Phenoliferia psychrophenolica]
MPPSRSQSRLHSLASLAVVGVLSLAPLARASPAAQTPTKRLTETDGFYNPADNGGSWLTIAQDTYPAGLGEPINGVLSANSDADVLSYAGFQDWAESVGYSGQCLGQSSGNPQAANLGDGHGVLNQTALLRWNYGDPALGTCTETIKGGSHFRYWTQNGTAANSGAYFMAISYEKNLTFQHDIIPDGYDVGRNEFIGNATVAAGTTSPLTGKIYHATSEMMTFLPVNSSTGINHGITTDGQVAIFTVKVSAGTSTAATASSTSKSTASTDRRSGLAGLAVLGLAMSLAVVIV